jgi:hypothetical protein
MSTACHKRASYLFETIAGAVAFRMIGRRKVYRVICSHCGRQHDLTGREAMKALKEARHDR